MKPDSTHHSKTAIEVWSASRFGDTVKVIEGKDGRFNYEVQFMDDKGGNQIASISYQHLNLLYEVCKSMPSFERMEVEEKQMKDKMSLTMDEVKAAIELRKKA